MIRFIGDVHSKFDRYLPLLDVPYPTFQVGDFGHGFAEVPDLDPKDRHIRGNHDNPALAKIHPNYIPDGHFENGMFFVGSAKSTDIHLRIKDEDWWEDEELSGHELWEILGKYEQEKPSIVVTHDAPERIKMILNGYYDINSTRTQQAFTAMMGIHKPDVWVFGHYHKTFDEIVDGVRFICVAELDTVDL